MATSGASGGSPVVGAKTPTVGKSLPEGPVTPFGPFHLLANPKTQSAEVARSVIESGELWGKTPGKEGNATAQAWRGPIPADAKPGSLEFCGIASTVTEDIRIRVRRASAQLPLGTSMS
ncbi:hypothetical protein ACFQ2K_11830 [Streptomyces sanglieri]|uniref:Uncharacterized protein n=2 Tax=Streptomyces TaxID=1883 RepID=A0ABW2WQ86_9ACTN